MTQEIEKQADKYMTEVVCKGCKNICDIDYAYAIPLRDSFQDGAKWGYDRALKELYEKLALHNTQLSLTVVVEKINQMGVQV